MTTLARICAVPAAVALAAAAGFSCNEDEAQYRACESGCTATEICWFARDICVPKPDPAGTCPADFVYRDCATGSCPTCRDCVAACLPAALAP
jgi:hypothetical protein